MNKSKKKISFRMWISLIFIGLAGQFAWSIENMYLNKFIFSFGSSNYSEMITLTVALSAITACLTTIFMGALSDKINKRKIFIAGGYILWGISTAAFGLINPSNAKWLFPSLEGAQAASILVIILDCVMTFFGSTSNDACFNSYVTKEIDNDNRGKVEGVLSILPLLSMLIIFGLLNSLTLNKKWDIFFYIIGGIVFIVGVASIFLLPKETKDNSINKNKSNYLSLLIEGFRFKTIKENINLYLILIGYLIYSIATQVFFPYLMIYFEYTLKISGSNFVIALGIILIVGSLLSVISGIIMDKIGKDKVLIPSIMIGFIGFLLMYFVKENDLILAIIFGTIMMYGYILIGTVLNSLVREYIPKNKEGVFMGVRMIFVVMLPMIIGPLIGNYLVNSFYEGTYTNPDYGNIQPLPPSLIWLVSSLILLLSLIPLIIYLIRSKRRNINNDSNKKKFDKNEGLIIKLKEEDKINDKNYIPLNEFPNPSFKRKNYQILNGWWDFKISKDSFIPQIYDELILVPYSPESPLSHINKLIDPDDYIFYHKKIILNPSMLKRHLFLYFLGVDQECQVYLNGIKVGENFSGYLPFKIDLTPLIKADTKELDIVIRVKDVTDSSYYSRGKQALKRGNIWYTSTSGIYKSIYLEAIESREYIKDFKIEYSIDKKEIYFNVSTTSNGLVEIKLNDDSFMIKSNEKVTVSFPNMKLWDLENPYLYKVLIKFNEDEVESYIGFRKIEIKNISKKNRLFLNDKEIILKGVLDQGYYYLGNLTPSSYNDYYQDILNIKNLGFNTIRKHIKYEDDIFYYYADKLGMLIIQDFVNGGDKYKFSTISFPALLPYRKRNVDLNYSRFKRENITGRNMFEKEILYQIHSLNNHPSIIIYTVFNEGWGQFDSSRFYDLIKKEDPSRLIDLTSGWYDNKKSDFYSKHIYFKKIHNFKKKNRASILSEFGGYSLYLKDHFFGKKPYGYKIFKDKESLSNAYLNLMEKEVIPTLKENNVGFIYTQLSDVEDEVNGIYTFDRKILKLDEKIVKSINEEIDKIVS